MPDTYVTLGGVTFDDFEVPESINGGGSQRLVVHKLVGGGRTVGAVGSDPDDISWSGRFRGSQAVQRMQQVDRMRQLGLPVTLSYAGLIFTVIIASFTFDYQRNYEIPYRITCTVSQPEVPPAAATSSVDQLVNSDLGSVGQFLSDTQADVTAAFADMAAPLAAVSSGLGTATSAISSLNGLAGLPTSQVTSVVTALNSAQTATQGAITIGDGNIFAGAQQIGGVIPSAPSCAGAALTGQIAALQNLSGLIVARGQLGRAVNNVQNAGAST